MQPVPQQGHGMRVPLLGQQPPQEQQMKLQVMQAISQMSMGMYVNLATAHITSIDVHQDLDEAKLRRLAEASNIAARAYFEGIGVLKSE